MPHILKSYTPLPLKNETKGGGQVFAQNENQVCMCKPQNMRAFDDRITTFNIHDDTMKLGHLIDNISLCLYSHSLLVIGVH